MPASSGVRLGDSVPHIQKMLCAALPRSSAERPARKARSTADVEDAARAAGPVRGFAVTLGIGILSTVFTAYTVTRQIIAFQSMVAIVAILFVLANFLVDMLYMYLDPQISYFEDK